MRLIPAIDLAAGRCVRLRQGDFAAPTRYAAEPMELLAQYRAMGADWLHVVDLDGARDGRPGNGAIIGGLAGASPLRLQVGGGLRERHDVERLLQAGVARCVVGSAAIARAGEVSSWLREFGGERIALAFDVRIDPAGTPWVATHGWQRQSQVTLWDAVAGYEQAGLRHVLCTDVARDGMLGGPNLELYREAARRAPQIAWQASGGIRDAGDLHALAAAGAAAAVSGKALLEGLILSEELQSFLPNA